MNPIKTTETLRIYWQQWVPSASMGQAMSPSAGSSTSGGGLGSNTGGAASASTNTIKKSRRELLTSSAAVRISSSGARAQDVTDLLRASSVIPPIARIEKVRRIPGGMGGNIEMCSSWSGLCIRCHRDLFASNMRRAHPRLRWLPQLVT